MIYGQYLIRKDPDQQKKKHHMWMMQGTTMQGSMQDMCKNQYKVFTLAYFVHDPSPMNG